MFQKTRYILTGWYILITVIVSVIFSLVIFFGISRQIQDFSQFAQFNQNNPELFAKLPKPPFPNVTPEMIVARMEFVLILVNIAIVFISAGAGYFLAGKSLKPVEEMIKKQSRFVSDASHELRAPITAIRTELEVASMNIDLDNAAQKVLKSSLEEIIHLQNLANDLLELNKYENQKYSDNFTQNNLLDISERSIANIIPLLKEKHITINNQFQDIQLLGDASTLIRLLTILLENAAKYSDDNKEITLHSKIHKGHIILEIKDLGIGISDKDKEHIFDRFYRVDTSRSRHTTSGFGLGLTIAKLILQKHSGSIRVESTIGKGSVFIVTLPYSA